MSEPKYKVGDIVEYSGPWSGKREVLQVDERDGEYFYFVDSFWWISEGDITGVSHEW